MRNSDGYVTTPRSICGCGKCRAWWFVHKDPFMLQEHAKTTKTDKKRFFARKDELGTQQTIVIYCPISINQIQKELCVDNKEHEDNRDIYCPACRSEYSVYISTNKTTRFHDGKKCIACCHALYIPFKDQKPTIMLFCGDDTHGFARKTNRDYDEEKPSPFLKEFLRQSQPSTSEPEPKEAEIYPFMAELCQQPIGWNS